MKNLILISALFTGCGARSPTEPDGPTTQAAYTPGDFVVLRAPGTAAQERLGVIRVGPSPFAIERVDGDLQALVDEMNAQTQVMSSGGTPVTRDMPEFFRIQRYGWLATERGLSLRPVVETTAPSRRYRVFTAGDPPVFAGEIEVDGAGYSRSLDGPLHPQLVRRNERENEAMDIAPPPGEIGKWGRIVPRDTPQFAALEREALVALGVLRVPIGTEAPLALTRVDGDVSAWLPGGLSAGPGANGALWSASGPPGGPLAVRVGRYEGVPAELPALLAVREPSRAYTADRTHLLEVCGRPSFAAAWSAGEGHAAVHGLVLYWPDVDRDSAGWDDRGTWIELEVPASADPPSAEAIAAHRDLAFVLASIQVRSG